MDKHLTHERAAASGNGFVYLFLGIALALAALALFVSRPSALMLGVAIVLMLGTLWCLTGLYMLQPNQAALLTCSAATAAPDRVGGLRWANVFYSKDKISVRAHNFNSEKLKVNDQRGNPIEIAAAIVWRVEDTARAKFDVEDFEAYVLTRPRPRCATSRRATRTTTSTTRSRPSRPRSPCVPAATRSARPCATNCRCASRSPASRSSTPS
jgi:hypothetical protein